MRLVLESLLLVWLARAGMRLGLWSVDSLKEFGLFLLGLLFVFALYRLWVVHVRDVQRLEET